MALHPENKQMTYSTQDISEKEAPKVKLPKMHIPKVLDF